MRFSYLSMEERSSILRIVSYGILESMSYKPVVGWTLLQMARPQYNQLFVKKPDLDDSWP